MHTVIGGEQNHTHTHTHRQRLQQHTRPPRMLTIARMMHVRTLAEHMPPNMKVARRSSRKGCGRVVPAAKGVLAPFADEEAPTIFCLRGVRGATALPGSGFLPGDTATENTTPTCECEIRSSPFSRLANLSNGFLRDTTHTLASCALVQVLLGTLARQCLTALFTAFINREPSTPKES